MPSLLRISEGASLALHTVAALADSDEKMVSVHEIASTLGVSENHLSKVCQRLAKAGLIEAHRGPKGGIKLGRSAGDIKLVDVYQAIDGPLKPTSCFLPSPKCDGQCILGNLVDSVNSMVLDYFNETTLADLKC